MPSARSPSSSASRSPRRAPSAADRGRSAERTREKILEAAVQEFGTKGFAGARTAGIAARAGVNQQLLAYYFGGKQGVLAELRRRWSARQDSLVPPDASFGESLRANVDQTLDNPDWARLVIWRALGDGASDDLAERVRDAAQRDRLQAAVDRVRRRQAGGELAADVDPAFILLVAYMIAFAPLAMPQVVEAVFETEPGSPDYRRRCVEQLVALLDPRR